MKRLVLAWLSFYRLAVSPYIMGRCRYVPSCSEYMSEAVRDAGVLRGVVAGLKRLLRCHPFGGHGLDPYEQK